jgi:hypothetical protein
MKRTPNRRVIVNIDSLVLNGVRYEDRYAVAQGLREQLTHLFAQPGVAQQLSETGSIPRLRVSPVHTATEAKPQQIGVAVANGIGKGLRDERG